MSHPDASPPPRRQLRAPDSSTPSLNAPAAPAIRMVSLGVTQVFVTFALPIALLASAVVVAVFSARPGSSDLAISLTIGAVVWLCGLAIQLNSHLAVWGAWGEKCESVTIGLLGIEFPPLHQPPRRLLVLSVATISPLLLTTFACVLAGIFIAEERPWWQSDAWIFPSLGWSRADAMWQAAGSLLLVQFCCQCFPLPRTPGRQILLAVIASLFRHVELPTLISVARRTLVSLALVIALAAVIAMPLSGTENIRHWMVLFFIAVMLWASSRSRDIDASVWSLANAGNSRSQAKARRPGHASTTLRRPSTGIRALLGRRRVRKAIERERSEAADASRLDEILSRLHDQGEKSLSNDDRAVLRRVSETLRTQRKSSDEPRIQS